MCLLGVLSKKKQLSPLAPKFQNFAYKSHFSLKTLMSLGASTIKISSQNCHIGNSPWEFQIVD